jgi:hypothetical protein
MPLPAERPAIEHLIGFTCTGSPSRRSPPSSTGRMRAGPRSSASRRRICHSVAPNSGDPACCTLARIDGLAPSAVVPLLRSLHPSTTRPEGAVLRRGQLPGSSKVPSEPCGSPGSWRCVRRRSSRRRKGDLCPAERAARSASALALSRSVCHLPCALSAGLLPNDIVCSPRRVA